jgi:hypothetical protein
MWACPDCGESIDAEFDVCWSCGTASDGTPDPNFQTADDAGPVVDPALDLNAADLADDPLKELPEPLDDLVECYSAHDLQEAKFLADQLVLQGIPAVADRLNPSHYLGGVITGYNPHVWVRVKDVGRARLWLDRFEESRRSGRDSHS